MPYITREDGERFIIPSYRDVISVKKQSLLRREILLLAQEHGEYITLQRKNVNQYEVAFSSDPGYLLGETVWNYFKRPNDLVYCEAIPNTFEAILVIVKSGSVYIDGSFPLDAIADELVVFRTQQSYFEIYVYGDVPISKDPEPGKFAFETSSVKSFTVLEKPIFPIMPTVKAFQLQLVDNVLKAKGIGVFPIKKFIFAIVVLGLLWMAWNYFATHKKQIPQILVQATNPYQGYLSSLRSPDPRLEMHWLAQCVNRLNTIPGWSVDGIDYSNETLTASVKSKGTRTGLLYDWAAANNATINIATTGFTITLNGQYTIRGLPQTISPLNSVVANLIDSISYIIPGNNLGVGPVIDKGKYAERVLTINFNDITPVNFDLIGQQFRNLPLIIVKVSIKIAENGTLSGSIVLRALGN